MSETPDAVELYTDGACSGNPGPGGWGVVLRWRGHEKDMFGGELDTTNNRMEISAVIGGLRALNRKCMVHIYTDSQYVKNGMTSWIFGWKKNGWKTADKKPVKNADLWQELDQLCRNHTIEWHWVKGHAGHPENERADALARQGVDAVRSGSLPASAT